ncbi:phenylalanine--tRNA ligase subunit beta [Anaeromyxobacter diazotrophicus]|uniref:Phenylalanine--tRNA ligase beta subunit n=1 Tax=Anaeromyxobacter diazotrophicus TaxID=2590199 RepID=A0A7I9VPD3_9BACT|nr:phenylalanine--tRNA ligase subunit beta [Anaeromyxobacter diazotrophicus]GEJ58272.1 phenylalanine--tRNA ligase beta subunit [Anaeromyxobacter diazotrophicus]
MRISYQWLSEYVDGLPAPEELARRLTAVGLEVEAVERRGGELGGVIAARIVASEKHPNAEKLSVTRVDAGQGEPLQVVCGAKNYQVGDVVPLATVGATLPGGVTIGKAKLRGVESSGMLCSAKELGIDADASGLLILPREVQPGTPIAKALGLDDVLLEVNVTPNRPDALSHLGIAREVAAFLGRPVKPPAPRLVEGGGPAGDAVRVRVEAPDRCHRYAARVIEGVKIGPSPAWLARRLEACGVRSISNAVDATNYVLLELGHPLHAFDLDQVAGHEIVARTARPGEKLTTLDGKERALDPEDLLIADRDRGSALAGVMGGGHSEITPGTTRLLLESAWFAPAGIRRTARRHGLKTEASYRFERGADPGMVLPALDRCAALIAELTGGQVRAGVVDAHPRPARRLEVPMRWARPAEVLGAPVPPSEARSILAGLGFAVLREDGEGATFAVPSWRQDVALEEDLIEEIVRSRGFESIPETLPRLALDTPGLPEEARVTARVREALEAAGFSEAVSFSFVPPADLAAYDPAGRPVLLENPISAELSAMRTGVLPSLLRAAERNLRQRVEDVRLYEVARAYGRGPGEGDAPADEWTEVAGVLLGRRSPTGWAAPADRVDLYDAKAALEGVLEALGMAVPRWAARPEPWSHPRASAALVGMREAVLGTAGELHPRVAQAFGLPRGTFAFRLDLAALQAHAELVPRYRGVPRFPAVLRDLAVVVADEVKAGAVVAAVEEEELVEDVTLFDVYTGAPLPAGKKNLALALRYRVPDRTLTDAEVDAAHGRIVARLREDPIIRAELRG